MKLKPKDYVYSIVIVVLLFISALNLKLIPFDFTDEEHSTVATRIELVDRLGDLRYYSSKIELIIHQLKNNKKSYENALKEIGEAQDSLTINWKSVSNTQSGSMEKELVSSVALNMKQYQQWVNEIKKGLQQHDSLKIYHSVGNHENANSITLIENVDKLLNYELIEAHRDKVKSKPTILFVIGLSFALLFLILAILLIFRYKQIIKSYLDSKTGYYFSKKIYKKFIEYNNEIVVILDKSLNLIEANELAINFFKYSRKELLEKNLSQLVNESHGDLQEYFKDVKKNKIGFLYKKILTKDNRIVHVELSNVLLNNGNFYVVVRNYVDRVKAEKIIRKVEDKYRYLFDNTPAYIIIWDLETLEVLEVNEAVIEKYGYSREEWSQMTILDYRPKEDFQKIRAFAKHMLQEDITIETKFWTHYNKKGEEMIMEIASHKIDYNNRKAILSMAKDYSNTAKLIEKEEQLNLFIEHSPVALAMLDLDMKYIAASRRWISDYGLLGKEITGKSHYEIFPEIPQRWKEIHQRCLQGFVEKREEDMFIREDGSIEWLRWEIRPWHKSSGEIGGIIIFTESITQRKKETELFQKQFYNSPDSILYVDKEYNIEMINKGISLTVEELKGKNFIEVLPEESRSIAKTALKKCFDLGEIQEIENTLHLNKLVRSKFIPVYSSQLVTHVMIIVTDISEQELAKTKLLQQEAHFKAIIDHVADAVLLLDEEVRIVYQSPAAEKISGYSYEEARGSYLGDFIVPDELVRMQNFMKEVFQEPGVPKKGLFKCIHKNGHQIWLEGMALNLLDNESVRSIIINYRDVSERIELEEKQVLNSLIVNSSEDVIISITIDGVITSWNKGAQKLLGYTFDEAVGKSIGLLLPESLKNEEYEFQYLISKDMYVENYETIRKCKNGELVNVSVTISPIKDPYGNHIGYSKIMHNITENKKYQEELIRYNTELKKINEELDSFVYSTSHDLRAPLKSMLGLIGITNRELELKSKDNPEFGFLLDRFSMLQKSAVKLDDFITEIIDYSRNARSELEVSVVDIPEMVHDIKTQISYMHEKPIDLKLVVKSDEIFCTDYKRFRIVLSNLITNSYKYSDPNKENSFIIITFDCDKNKAFLTIEDNGIGISENDLQKIFNMFYRASTLSSGSGLGLYIVKEAIEKLHGTYKVQSTLGVGSVFSVEIPNHNQP